MITSWKEQKKKRKVNKMKEKKYSSYATNKGGKIESPKGKSTDEPRSTKRGGDDLRVKRG